MAITADVKNQLFRQSSAANGQEKLIRLPAEPPCASAASGRSSPASPFSGGSNGRAWTPEEHDRFLEGLEMFPSGPWKEIAAHVGTRTTRQTMTHAQKYREKIARRKRGLRAPTASSVSARALRRQQPGTANANAANAMRDVSPRSVDAPLAGLSTPSSVMSSPSAASDASAIEFVALAQCEDPLDFAGCFGSFVAGRATPYLQPAYAAASSMHMLEFGSFLVDVEPLPMSEEEIDQLLDAAATLPAAYPETAFIV